MPLFLPSTLGIVPKTANCCARITDSAPDDDEASKRQGPVLLRYDDATPVTVRRDVVHTATKLLGRWILRADVA